MNNSEDISEEKVNADPFIQFEKWYKEHLVSGIVIPDAVSLGTSTADGHISVRTVLMKDFSENGFVFYTNYNSRKGSQLSSNPKAALLFYWPESERQVRIEGSADKVTEKDSEAYFKTRPRESQISAWASEQSSIIPGRHYLEKRYDMFYNMFRDKSVDKPPYWGGFRLIPDWFEFWQSGDFRLHDRITYSKRKNIWVIERLAP
jgi:pyridoxamine 5'-phosphate oxidase